MTYQKELLVNYRQFHNPQRVGLGDGRSVEALGVGNVNLEMIFKVSESKHMTMFNVLYVPNLAANLFSVGAAAEKEKILQFGHSRCWIRDKSRKLCGAGTRSEDGLYHLDCKPVTVETAALATNQNRTLICGIRDLDI